MSAILLFISFSDLPSRLTITVPNRSTCSIVNDEKIQRTFPVFRRSVVLNVYYRRAQSKRSVLKWPTPVRKTISSYFTRFNVAYKRAPLGFCRFGLSVWDPGRKKKKQKYTHNTRVAPRENNKKLQWPRVGGIFNARRTARLIVRYWNGCRPVSHYGGRNHGYITKRGNIVFTNDPRPRTHEYYLCCPSLSIYTYIYIRTLCTAYARFDWQAEIKTTLVSEKEKTNRMFTRNERNDCTGLKICNETIDFVLHQFFFLYLHFLNPM